MSDVVSHTTGGGMQSPLDAPLYTQAYCHAVTVHCATYSGGIYCFNV